MWAFLGVFINYTLHMADTGLQQGGTLTEGPFQNNLLLTHQSAEMLPTIRWCCSVIALLPFYLLGEVPCQCLKFLQTSLGPQQQKSRNRGQFTQRPTHGHSEGPSTVG